MFCWHSFYFRAGLGLLIGSLLFIHSLWLHCCDSRKARRVIVAQKNNDRWLLWLLFCLLFTMLITPSLSMYFGAGVSFAGFMIASTGLLLACFSRHSLGLFWNNRVEVIEGHRWKNDGVYYVWAHPIYFGEFLVSLGGFVLSGHIFGFLYMVAVWQINQSKAIDEEKALTAHIGQRPSEPLARYFIRRFKSNSTGLSRQ